MIPIDYVCFLNQSGYSQAAQDTILALDHSGHFDVRVSCIHKSPVKAAFSRSSLNLFTDLCNKPARNDAVQVFHCIPEKQNRFKRLNKAISFATFETYKPPEKWITLLNRMDAVVCPSQFNYQIFAHSGIKRPLFHVPHTIDISRWNDGVLPMRRFDRFTFLFVGTWRKRKGWPQLVEAWFQEFSQRDRTQLLIHTDKAETAKRDIAVIKRDLGLEKKETAPILIEDTVVDDLSLPSFFKSADCLVSPSLGEGFGLPALQCMALKVPVITTNFGGCKDYATADNCILVEPSGFLIHDCLDNIPQFRGCKWPRITVQSVRHAMRSALECREENRSKSENAYTNVRENFSSQVTVDKFLELMEMVYRVRQTAAQTV